MLMGYMVGKCSNSMENVVNWDGEGPRQEKLLFLQFLFNTSNYVLYSLSLTLEPIILWHMVNLLFKQRYRRLSAQSI